MTFRMAALCLLTLLLLISAGSAKSKQAARIEKLGEVSIEDVHVAPTLSSADTCHASDYQELAFRIDGWVTGVELYKSYIDPERDCPAPWPYTVTEINMPMIFGKATSLVVSVDIEEVDDTTISGCSVPGAVVAVSTDWELTIPEGGGLFNIWIPLDTPIVVTRPFFAGFYLASPIDTSVGAAVLCDSFPVPCRTFNIWDETTGWVDLVNNSTYNFPGHLAMEVAGIPGGNSSDTSLIPQVALVAPVEGEVLFGEAELWAWDQVDSEILDYVAFEVKVGAGWSEVGRAYDGAKPLRDGVNPAVNGTGLTYTWNFSILPEGDYWLRATAVDTLGRSTSDSILVTLEPTPPRPTITSPDDGGIFCDTLDLIMSCNDEDMSYIEIFRRDLSTTMVSSGMTALSQFALGDVDGYPDNGNSTNDGEFGDYYSGPAAAAIAARVWYNRGYTALMQDGGSTLTIEELAEKLAELFLTRENLGTFDEAFYPGLVDYLQSHGDEFEVSYMRNPGFYDVRAAIEDAEQTVMLGLGGAPGLWVGLNGFAGWLQADTTWRVTVANPLTGALTMTNWRRQVGYDEILIEGVWHKVDIMVGMIAKDWTVARDLVGADFSNADGWSFAWPVTGISEGDISYFRAIGRDASNYRISDVVIVEYDCSSSFMVGDYNGDRVTDISDLHALIAFIAEDGAPPDGGGQRADCNCDNVVNVVDIVYYMNYLFGTSGPPCH
ncbi:MAG: hypothetical protein GY867_10690 [bacterium]|nr:hypothetical protein [bacterium]